MGLDAPLNMIILIPLYVLLCSLVSDSHYRSSHDVLGVYINVEWVRKAREGERKGVHAYCLLGYGKA